MAEITYVSTKAGWGAEKAQRYGEALIVLHEKKPEGITTYDVVEAASAKKSPLHDIFEWDDSIAAGKWRIEQAGMLLRSIEVKFSENFQEPIRAFISINLNRVNDDKHDEPMVYRRVESVMDNEVQRAYVMKRLQEELRSFEQRLRRFEGFAQVVSAIREHLKKAA